MDKDKKPEFVVTDRRKFNVDGEPRPDAPPEKPATESATDSKPQAAQATPVAESTAKTAPQSGTHPEAHPETQAKAPAEKLKIATFPTEQFPPVPSGSEIETGYNGDKERTSFGGQKMEFIHLLDMLVQTAMMYAGAMEGGTERRVDVVGLRQMIDLIAVLDEKTKGNLTEQEAAILKNTVFQLRMTYMEIVNMIDRQAMQKAPGGPGAPRK
jgi:hypothetical protein